jgi:hypothetical protein
LLLPFRNDDLGSLAKPEAAEQCRAITNPEHMIQAVKNRK